MSLVVLSPLIRVWDFAVRPDVLGLAMLLFAALVAVAMVVVAAKWLRRRRG